MEVIAALTMSLDGYIAGPHDDVNHLFKWYFAGDVEFPVKGTDMAFKISQASADLLTEEWDKLGAFVTGRRDFDVSHAWGGKGLLGLPTFIVTHNPPQQWVYDGSPFTFVTDGVESAINQAKAVVGDKNIGVGGTTIVQQCLKLGLLDGIHIDLAHMLLGGGIRLFDNDYADKPIELEQTRLVQGLGVTHLTYRVVK